jgi:hypothetical protein
MAQTHKLLGRARPSAITVTTIYTAPASTKAMLSSIFVCNTSSVVDYLRLYVVPSGGSAAVGNAIYSDLPIAGNDSLLVNGVPVLEAGDFLAGYSLNGTLTYTVSGMEIS